ncbi:TetR family transcriptional regulator [Saccharomonospora piscinae]|uniref:TetR family transcriptional regulator n=1 Tax=Saccharomonospora piscinae TaxID=687388 RepID=A0A1V8ZXN3_SACPI|nr:TetR/AcrR family transcriptional regulator [Saccharomonospora piscinae]OQO89444.1 TetR family transcriptional regulator [Saccharomonospora piscinae]
MNGRTNVERGRDVRARLLQAARELVGELGWTAVSTRVLAERAGVRAGLVHYHFESLAALLRQAALDEMRRVVAETAAHLKAAADPAAAVGALVSEVDRYDGSDPASRLFLEAYLAATRDAVLHDSIAELMKEFRSAVATTLARAGHPDPDGVAVLLLAVIDGLLLHRGLDPTLSAARIRPLLSQMADTEENGARQ